MVRITLLDRTMASKPEPVSVKFGLHYNFYVGISADKITSSDTWLVPTQTILAGLSTYLGGDSVAGGKLKDTVSTYWNAPNTGATNLVSFNGRGAGYRNLTGFVYPKIDNLIWSSTEHSAPLGYYLALNSNSASCSVSGNYKYFGASLRLYRAATAAEQLATDGTIMNPYIGNDLKQYTTVKIGTLVWMAYNLSETKLRSGAAIPEVTDQTAWAALITPGLCAFNNDWSNVLI